MQGTDNAAAWGQTSGLRPRLETGGFADLLHPFQRRDWGVCGLILHSGAHTSSTTEMSAFWTWVLGIQVWPLSDWKQLSFKLYPLTKLSGLCPDLAVLSEPPHLITRFCSSALCYTE